ncbi:MAG: regulatory iron-sulfur-containing complex subunit RicT [Candidatus Moranbacteria bacterium]|nr:regulatory iron-sulfur-containing complex subunit RicT [Candidatus Moranbacteria bacterium]
MKVIVSVYSWESPKLYGSDADLKKGEKVIVAGEYANELGTVLGEVETEETPELKVLRVATQRDREVYKENQSQKKEYLKIGRAEAKNAELEIKIIDALASLDGKQVIFVFTADGRIDFRKLVKDVSAKIKKSVRMQQIGSRDEARRLGGYGICGRELCCVRFKGNMQSITTEMARVQQIAHRGSERISGLCGRLMCCLAYEAEQYQKLLKGMPELYSIIETAGGKGTVVEINAIEQKIKIKLEKGEYVTIKKEDIR